MIDTLYLNLTLEKPNMMKGISSKLDKYSKSVNAKTGEFYYTGYLENLRISINSQRLAVKGSMPKFLTGNNFNTLTRSGIELCCEKINDSLGIDSNQAKVSRLDIADNILMDSKPSAYFPNLISAKHMKRLEVDKDSLYFKNNQRQLVFYDKAEESGSLIKQSEHFGNCNVLRYECRYTRQVSQRFGLNKLTLNDLFSEELYMKLVEHWHGEYMSISKVSNDQKLPVKLDSIKSLKTLGTALLIDSYGGKAELLKLIDQQINQGLIKPDKNVQRLKKEIRDHVPIANNAESDLIAELDSKITDKVKYFR